SRLRSRISRLCLTRNCSGLSGAVNKRMVAGPFRDPPSGCSHNSRLQNESSFESGTSRFRELYTLALSPNWRPFEFFSQATSFLGKKLKGQSPAMSMPHSTKRLTRSEEHTSELQSLAYLVCRLLLEKKKKKNPNQRP